MICNNCRNRKHGVCRGGTWCDCQHVPVGHTRQSAQAAGEPGEVVVDVSPDTSRIAGNGRGAGT